VLVERFEQRENFFELLRVEFFSVGQIFNRTSSTPFATGCD